MKYGFLERIYNVSNALNPKPSETHKVGLPLKHRLSVITFEGFYWQQAQLVMSLVASTKLINARPG